MKIVLCLCMQSRLARFIFSSLALRTRFKILEQIVVVFITTPTWQKQAHQSFWRVGLSWGCLADWAGWNAFFLAIALFAAALKWSIFQYSFLLSLSLLNPYFGPCVSREFQQELIEHKHFLHIHYGTFPSQKSLFQKINYSHVEILWLIWTLLNLVDFSPVTLLQAINLALKLKLQNTSN